MIRRKGMQEWTVIIILFIFLIVFIVIGMLVLGWLDNAVGIIGEVAKGGS